MKFSLYRLIFQSVEKMKLNLITPILLALAFITTGCTKPAEPLRFTGTWMIQKENGITAEKTQTMVQVSVDNNRFKTDSKGPEEEIIEIYDGKNLTTKITNFQDVSSGKPPSISTVEKSDNEMEPRRFWKKNFTSESLPGGQIAGRETLLYQIQESIPGKSMTRQSWVDADTKVLLRNIFTIYSVQIAQILSKTTAECQEIHYAPVDESTFAKPE